MKGYAPAVASEQARAFVALVNYGNYRAAAESLHLTREGLRRRLLMLEERLHVRLYEKERGRHTNIRLTPAGNVFYIKSVQFLEEARALTELFDCKQPSLAIKISVSDYVADTYLSAMLMGFHRQYPGITISVTTGAEQDIVSSMQQNSEIKLGICACDSFPEKLIRKQLFTMSWAFIAQMGHPLLQQPRIGLSQLANESLITFQAGCPARQRILNAFQNRSIAPNAVIDVATIQMVLNLVESGFGTAIIPVLRPCTILRGRRVGMIPLANIIDPVEIVLLAQPDCSENVIALKLLDCIFDQFGYKRMARTATDRKSSRPHTDVCALAQTA